MRKLRRYVSLFFMLVTAAATIQQLLRPSEERDWQGQVLFVPYDLRPFTPDRIRERWWNPDDPRLLTPHVFGAGWSVNLYRLKELLAQPARTNGDG
jgi:hypothetical protein